MEFGECKSCGRKILWGMTHDGKRIPLDASAPVYRFTDKNYDGSLAPTGIEWLERAEKVYVSHFNTCPTANNHSRKVDRRPPAQGSLFNQGEG